MSASIFLMGIPLFYAFLMYAVLGLLPTLGVMFLMALVIAGLITGIVAAVQVFSTGLNAAGTFIVFIVVVSASFYGLSVAGYAIGTAANPTIGAYPFKSWLDVIFACMYSLGTFFLVSEGARSG